MTMERTPSGGGTPGGSGLSGDADFQRRLLAQMNTLYRGRPFTKAIPFNKTLPLAGFGVDLWVPNGAMFELAMVHMISTVVAADLALCDTRVDSPFFFIMPSTTEYTQRDLSPGYRGNPIAGGRLILINPAGAVGSVKGVLFGYEVTLDGYYR